MDAETGRFLRGKSRQVTLGLEAGKIAKDLVFLTANAALAKVLLKPRQHTIADRPRDLEINVFRHQIKALVARDFLVVGVGDVSHQASQRWAFQV
ncbi:MAG: hypothetical protein DME02_23240 [Candidatus Rokuibacteriota bacterium]|nr:MAG: hypothetical protein DME02_23240 [Candidatus Rokubacteria bacterium]